MERIKKALETENKKGREFKKAENMIARDKE